MSAPLKEPTDPVRVILSADVIYDEDNDAYTLTTEQFPTGSVGFDHDFKRYFNFSFCYTITKHSAEGTGTLKFQWGDKYAHFNLSVNHSATAGATYEVTYTDDRLQLLDTISSGPLTGFAYDTVQTVRIDAMFDTLFIYLDNARISTDDMDVSEYENAFINPVILWEATNIGFGVFTHRIDTIFCLNNVVFEEPVFVNQSIYAKEYIGVTWDSLGDNPLPYVLQFNESQPDASNVFIVLGTADDSNIAQLDVINSNHMISLGVPIEAHSNAFLTTFGPSGLALGTDGNERIVITASGNVGIGTTAPTELLDVAGVIRADHYVATSTALCSNLNAELLAGRDSNWYRQYANLIGTPEILNSQWTTNGTSIHYNGGNVGIGSDAPTEQLDVAGLVRAARYLATTTGLCSNVNADLLDGQEGDWYRDFANLLNKPDIVENEEMSSLLSAISSSIIGSAAGGIGGAIGGFLKGLFSPDGDGGFQLDGVNWNDINGKPDYMSRWSGDSYNVNNIVGCIGDGLSGGYVGIGVEHPTHKLDVKGVTQLDGTLKFKAGPTADDFQTTFENYGDDFVIATGCNQLTPSSHVVLKRSAGGEQQTEFVGSVGIGTATALEKFHLVGKAFIHTGTTGAPANGTYGGNNGTRIILWPGGSTSTPYALGINSSTLWYGVPSTAAHRWYAGTTELMTLISTGNVGIGTATPTQKLHIIGNILSTGSIDAGTQFLGNPSDTVTTPSFSFTGNANTGMYSPTANEVAFATNGTQRAVINASGNVGIGTATPTSPLTVWGASRFGTTTNGTTISVNYGRWQNLMDEVSPNQSLTQLFNRVQTSSVLPTANRTMYNIDNQYYNDAIGTTTSGQRSIIYGTRNYCRNAQTDGGAGHIYQWFGTRNIIENWAGATAPNEVANAYGTYNEVHQYRAGTTTNAYGTYNYMLRTAGTMTNSYGVYVNTSGTITNSYGVYCTGEQDNYFSGNVGIGTTNPLEKLHVVGDLMVTGAITGTQSVGRIKVSVFTSSGTFTVPSGVTAVKVTVVGGGGGGGGKSSTSSHSGGGGGGGGGTAFEWITGLTPGTAIAVTIGLGGAGTSTAGGTGGNGGTSSFGTYVSATGGSGGSGVFGAANGGNGGFASGGTIHIFGHPGRFGWGNSDFPIAGAGGGSYLAPGTKDNNPGYKTASHGINAYTFGGGGGGAVGTSSSSVVSGSGNTGIVIVEYI